MEAADHIVERVVRESYGRLLAFLAARSGDLAGAEDALADAFARALETWPKTGIPDTPEAWLLVVARRRLADAARHAGVHQNAVGAISEALSQAGQIAEREMIFPDERLQMLFLCSHPAIDESARTPLMLQAVLGLDAARIASAFLLRTAAMSQRLVRAKAKIKEARICFELPDMSQLKSRLPFVLDAIYAAYSTGWSHLGDADAARKELAAEAIYLGQLLVTFLPNEPEAHGLLALMLYCESRKASRYSEDGTYLPLKQQDKAQWARAQIIEAENHLTRASSHGRMGRFQIEAAIQSAHIHQAYTGATNSEAIALLYQTLLAIAPSIGARVSHAAAVAETEGASAALALLEQIPRAAVESYQPYWALNGHLHKLAEQPTESIAAYRRAVELTEQTPIRQFLEDQMAAMARDENG